MRYPQGDWLTAERHCNREELRLQTAERFARGEGSTSIAGDLRVSVRSVQRWRHAWAEGGPRSLRSQGPASLPRLSEKQFAQLERELAKGPAAHGWEDQHWTLGRVKTVIGRRFHLTYTVQGVRRRSMANAFATAGQASRSSTVSHHAGAATGRAGRPSRTPEPKTPPTPRTTPISADEVFGKGTADGVPSAIATAKCTSTLARSRQSAAVPDGSSFASACVSLVRSAHGAAAPPRHARSASSRQPPPTADGPTPWLGSRDPGGAWTGTSPAASSAWRGSRGCWAGCSIRLRRRSSRQRPVHPRVLAETSTNHQVTRGV